MLSALKITFLSFLGDAQHHEDCGSKQPEKFLKPIHCQLALECEDGVRRTDILGTCINAAKNRTAIPHAGAAVNLYKKLQAPVVAGISHEAEQLSDCRRSQVLLVKPEHRAGTVAAGAQDAVYIGLKLFLCYFFANLWAQTTSSCNS